MERGWHSSHGDTYREVRATLIVEHSTQQERRHPRRLSNEHARVHSGRSPNASIAATRAHVVVRPRDSIRRGP